MPPVAAGTTDAEGAQLVALLQKGRTATFHATYANPETRRRRAEAILQSLEKLRASSDALELEMDRPTLPLGDGSSG